MTASPSLQFLPWEDTALQTFLIKRKARLDKLAEQRRKNRNTPNIINKNACDQNSINFISDIINKLNFNTNTIFIFRESQHFSQSHRHQIFIDPECYHFARDQRILLGRRKKTDYGSKTEVPKSKCHQILH